MNHTWQFMSVVWLVAFEQAPVRSRIAFEMQRHTDHQLQGCLLCITERVCATRQVGLGVRLTGPGTGPDTGRRMQIAGAGTRPRRRRWGRRRRRRQHRHFISSPFCPLSWPSYRFWAFLQDPQPAETQLHQQTGGLLYHIIIFIYILLVCAL